VFDFLFNWGGHSDDGKTVDATKAANKNRKFNAGRRLQEDEDEDGSDGESDGSDEEAYDENGYDENGNDDELYDEDPQADGEQNPSSQQKMKKPSSPKMKDQKDQISAEKRRLGGPSSYMGLNSPPNPNPEKALFEILEKTYFPDTAGAKEDKKKVWTRIHPV
jgi:hypothetical protein